MSDNGVTDNDTVRSLMQGGNFVNPQDLESQKAEQNFSMAIVGGLIASTICVAVWATITVLTKYQISYMAIGVGFVVGYTIQKFGKGMTFKYGLLGAVLSLLTCIIGNLVSHVCLFANEFADYTYMEAFSNLDVETASYVLINNAQMMDVLFYGLAIYCGYMFSIKKEY